MPDEHGETLRRLEERLGRASDTAERLIAEAARMGQGGKPPAAGWDSPPPREQSRPGGELEVVVQAIRSLRELIPPEVLERLADAVREMLTAIRALIDFYLERLDRARTEPDEVEEIPIR